jgi:hypothetical protein
VYFGSFGPQFEQTDGERRLLGFKYGCIVVAARCANTYPELRFTRGWLTQPPQPNFHLRPRAT